MLFRTLNYKLVINSLRYLKRFKVIKYHLQRSFLHFTILQIGEGGSICSTASACPNTAHKYSKKELYHLFIKQIFLDLPPGTLTIPQPTELYKKKRMLENLSTYDNTFAF